MTTRTRVFICSALRGDSTNESKALGYSKFAVKRGVSPYTPHVFLTRFLDDSVEAERCAGMECGLSFLPACEELWAFTVNGRISTGMLGEINEAIDLGIPVRWFAVDVSIGTPIELLGLPTDAVPCTSELMTPKRFAAVAAALLGDVEKRLLEGALYEDSLEDIDALFGTGLPKRDRQIEADWTNTYQEVPDESI